MHVEPVSLRVEMVPSERVAGAEGGGSGPRREVMAAPKPRPRAGPARTAARATIRPNLDHEELHND